MKQVFKMCSMQNILRITYIRIWRFQTLKARRRWYKFVHIHWRIIRMESYILVYSNNLTILFSWFLVFLIRATKSTKWQIYFWTKLIYIHFLHHAIRLTTGKNQCLWTCLLVCMRMAWNCYHEDLQRKNICINLVSFPEIIRL